MTQYDSADEKHASQNIEVNWTVYNIIFQAHRFQKWIHVK